MTDTVTLSLKFQAAAVDLREVVVTMGSRRNA